MTFSRAVALVLGLALAGTLWSGVPASAEDWRKPDAVKDLQFQETETSPVVVVRGEKFGDIVRTRAKYGRYSLVIWTKFRDLRRNAYAWNVHTVRTKDRQVTIDHEFTNDEAMIIRGNGTIRSCRGLKEDQSFAKNWTWLKVPRRCLDRPDWVRFSTLFRYSQGAGRPPRAWDCASRKAGSRCPLSQRLSRP